MFQLLDKFVGLLVQGLPAVQAWLRPLHALSVPAPVLATPSLMAPPTERARARWELGELVEPTALRPPFSHAASLRPFVRSSHPPPALQALRTARGRFRLRSTPD